MLLLVVERPEILPILRIFRNVLLRLVLVQFLAAGLARIGLGLSVVALIAHLAFSIEVETAAPLPPIGAEHSACPDAPGTGFALTRNPCMAL